MKHAKSLPVAETLKLAPFFQEISDSIARGEISRARQAITQAARHDIPRAQLQPLASLALRADLPELASRLLYSTVRPPRGHASSATAAEQAEYALTLSKLGASFESLAILQHVDARAFPKALAYRAYAHFARWEYAEAIPFLERYLALGVMTEYERAVAQTNLAAAYVALERFDDAIGLLRSLEISAKENGTKRLHAMLLEIEAQIAVEKQEWKEAEALLSGAVSILGDLQEREGFFVRKWRAILDVYRRPEDARTRAALDRFQGEAGMRTSWETVRDCDFHRALATEDEGLLTRLYFGTPFAAYRKRIETALRGKRLPPSFRYQLEPGPDGWFLDLAHGLGEAKRERGKSLKTALAHHRLLLVLAGDFYRPQRLAEIHAALFPGEYFNPDTSPNRVHQSIVRARAWMKSERIALQVVAENGWYRLASPKACQLLVPRPDFKGDRLCSSLALLHEHWGTAEFSVEEAARRLEIPLRSMQRILKDATSSDQLVRRYVGRKCRYSFRAGTIER